MSGETSRSDDSAPSLSSYPLAFVSLISTLIQRSEDAETRAHKALVILKDKDKQVAELQKRMESLESMASRLYGREVPPLELPLSSSSSYIGKGSPHPRELEDKELRTQSDNLILETLYENRLTSPMPETKAEDSGDCYAKCKRLLAEIQRSDIPKDKSKTPRITSKNNKEQLPSVTKSSSDINIDLQNNRDLVVIDKEYIKQNVNMAKSIINSLQKRFEDEDHIFPERSTVPARTNLSSKSVGLKSSRSSISSYHTPKSKISSRFLIRRRKTTHCFFSTLNNAHKKLRLKYKNVSEKFKESLTLCEKLQDDIVYLSKYRNGSGEERVDILDKQTQTQVATRGSTSLLQGRLDAASQAMRSRLVELQDLRTQLDDRQTSVVSLKKKLARAEADGAMKELQLVEAASVNDGQSLKLQQLELQITGMKRASEHIGSREETCRKELEQMRRSMEMKIAELEDLVKDKDSNNALAVRDLEGKVKRLEGHLLLHIVEASKRLAAADTKIRQLYLAIQTFLKMVFGPWKDAYCESINARGQPDWELQAMRVASEILQLPPPQLHKIMRPSTNVNKWLEKCKTLVFEEDFADRLGCLLVDAVCEAKHS